MQNFFSVFLIFIACVTSANAQTILTCTNPKGQAYYPYQGVMPKDKSGWSADAITGGSFSLSKIGDRKYDILYIDSTKRVQSTSQSGGEVILVSATDNEMTFLVNYSGVNIETYFFFKNKSNNYEMLLSQTKYGAGIAKVALYQADCT